MKKLQEKVLKPIVIVLLILILTFVDFLVLGMQIISYAIDEIEKTNEENVLFSAYFLSDENNKESMLEKSMIDDNIRLCLEIKVNNEGYFNGKIQINNSNFKFKTDIENKYVNSITENGIVLNQIEANKHVILELNIIPIKENVYDLSLLNRKTDIEITGTYVTSSSKNKEIYDVRHVQLVLNSPYSNDTKENGLEIDSQIVTNKVYEINGENKRILQMEIKTGLLENEYPVKSTKIMTDVLGGVEDIKVEKRGTYATNNDVGDIQSNWDKVQNKFVIQLLNEEVDGKIQWIRNQKDSILVTFILGENERVIGKEIGVNVQVELYDSANTIIVKNIKIINRLKQ